MSRRRGAGGRCSRRRPLQERPCKVRSCREGRVGRCVRPRPSLPTANPDSTDRPPLAVLAAPSLGLQCEQSDGPEVRHVPPVAGYDDPAVELASQNPLRAAGKNERVGDVLVPGWPAHAKHVGSRLQGREAHQVPNAGDPIIDGRPTARMPEFRISSMSMPPISPTLPRLRSFEHRACDAPSRSAAGPLNRRRTLPTGLPTKFRGSSWFLVGIGGQAPTISTACARRATSLKRWPACAFAPRGMVLPDRIELSTSPLPRERSTTELRYVGGPVVAASGRIHACTMSGVGKEHRLNRNP